jgi:hypothetical protein
VLLHACPSTSSHTRPQLPEHDGAFVAVERSNGGNGWCRIRRGGQDKIMWSSDFPPTVGDVDVKGLRNQKFNSLVWRDGGCGAGAGGGNWMEGGQLRARVCNAAAAAVEVHSAVDAAAAMQSMVSGWTEYTNRITVDPQAGCVSYEQDFKCIIFSVDGGPRVQFVQVKGLPPSFIDVQRAQEVRGNAREMKPPQPPPALPPPTAPFIQSKCQCTGSYTSTPAGSTRCGTGART